MHALVPTPEVFRPATAFQVLQSPTRRRVLDVLRARGPMTFTELADYLQVSSLKLNFHLELLEELGLVRFRKTSPTDASAREIVFRPVGWARLRKQWTEGTRAI